MLADQEEEEDFRRSQKRWLKDVKGGFNGGGGSPDLEGGQYPTRVVAIGRTCLFFNKSL